MNESELSIIKMYIDIFSKAQAYYTLMKEFIETEIKENEEGRLKILRTEIIEYSKDTFDDPEEHSVTFTLDERCRYTLELIESSSTLPSSIKKDVVRTSVVTGSIGGAACLTFIMIDMLTVPFTFGIPAFATMGLLASLIGGGAGIGVAALKTGAKTSVVELKKLAKNPLDELKRARIQVSDRPDGKVEIKFFYIPQPGLKVKLKLNFVSAPKNIGNLRSLLESIIGSLTLLNVNIKSLKEFREGNFHKLLESTSTRLKEFNKINSEIESTRSPELKYFKDFASADVRYLPYSFALSDSEIDKTLALYDQTKRLSKTTEELHSTKHLYGLFVDRQESLVQRNSRKISKCLVDLQSASNNVMNNFTRPILQKDKDFLLSLLYKSSSVAGVSNPEAGERYNKQLLIYAFNTIQYLLLMWLRNIDNTLSNSTELKATLEQYHEIISSSHDELTSSTAQANNEDKKYLLESLSSISPLLDDNTRFKTNSELNTQFLGNYLKDIITYITSDILVSKEQAPPKLSVA